jgi:hypothetical protein
MTPSQLLEAALAALDGDEFELARRLGYSMSTANRQFARWRNDQGMNFRTTIQLLEIAGCLSVSSR